MSNQAIAMKVRKLFTDSFTRTAAVIGIMAAVGGPAAMLAFGGSQASNLPWYIWVVAALLFLSVIGIGYYKSTLNHDDGDISISPRNRQ
ncbi:MAG TPA: hypothetical protein VNS63_12085 [Blastocatellia bacterium]|nr:hypothetical protein [Blastocatellia bacterium]